MTFKDILSDNRGEKLLSCEKDVTTKEMTRFDRKIYIVLEVGKQLTPEIYIHSVTTVIKNAGVISNTGVPLQNNIKYHVFHAYLIKYDSHIRHIRLILFTRAISKFH